MTNQQPPTIFFIATNRKTYSRRHHHEQPLRFVPPKSQPFIVAPRFATTISTKPSHCETCRKSQQHHLATIESRVIHRLPRTTSKPSSLIARRTSFRRFNVWLRWKSNRIDSLWSVKDMISRPSSLKLLEKAKKAKVSCIGDVHPEGSQESCDELVFKLMLQQSSEVKLQLLNLLPRKSKRL
ncbi:hypothetical protein VIGAN_06060300 [Vigna angularis var. angularis]|uniref:Uncharacterized protein n=1 Tax=Vigna angularis var. angularis TaxID=157739 RepID=A0A0S3SA23_PHAAN|nr:hypothetical protein VIGAN_06060300 [Vigna angularis var. angularis]